MKTSESDHSGKMEVSDYCTIVEFAAGDQSKRTAAVAAHRKYLQAIGARGTPAQDFMAEVDNPCPDFALRASSPMRFPRH